MWISASLFPNPFAPSLINLRRCSRSFVVSTAFMCASQILGCTFSDNYAPDGVVATLGVTDLLISDCHMSRNVITNHGSYGAIYARDEPINGVNGSNIVVEGTVFDNNLPGATGSAIAVLQTGANVTITGCHFTHVPFNHWMGFR